MRNYALILLLLISTTSFAQNYIPFASGRVTDTAKTAGSILIPYIVRLPYYAVSDTDKVFGVTSNGTLVLRTKGTGGGADSAIYPTQYQLDTAKKKLRSQLADSLNAMNLNRAASNGATINRAVTFSSGSGNVVAAPATTEIYGYTSSDDRWGLSSTGSGVGTYGILNLYYNDGTNRRMQFIPSAMSGNSTTTLRSTSGTMAYTSDTANCVQDADSNVARGWLSYSYWLANRNLGTVTSITATSPLTGGTITTSGNIGLGTVGYSNGGTNATTFTAQRLIYSGINTLKTHDSVAFDTASANGYLGLGTTAPTTPIHLKRQKAINITSEYVGNQSGIFCAGVQFKNPSGSTFDVGMRDNAPTGVFRIGGAEYATFNNGGFTFGTIAGQTSAQNCFTFTCNPANASGTSAGFLLTVGGNNSSTGGLAAFKINVTSTLGGSGTQRLFDMQRYGVTKHYIDTGGAVGTPFLVGLGSTPSIAAGSGAGTGPTVSITGCDGWGYITLTTGSAPSSSATVVTVTFAVTKSAAPKKISIHPGDENSAALTGGSSVYADIATSSTTTWQMKVGSTGLAASTTYIFVYDCAQ